MAERVSGKSMNSHRAKTILSMVDSESPTSSVLLTADDDKKDDKVVSMHDTINKIYARPYSMTSSIFDNFCETQNTLTSHHCHDLKFHLNILNEVFPKSGKENNIGNSEASCSQTQQPITLTPVSPEPMNLTCHEEMPILTPNSKTEEQLKSEVNNNRSRFDPDDKHCTDSHVMPGSPVPITGLDSFDFDSDDSVRDKNYVPSDSSKDSDDDQEAARLKQKVFKRHNSPKIISAKSGPSLLSQPPHQTPNNNIFIKKRCMSVENSKMKCAEAEKNTSERQNTNNDNNNEEIALQETLDEDNNGNMEIVSQATDNEENQREHTPPKRRRYDTSLAQRTQEKKAQKRMEYAVKSGCNENCLKKCSTKLSEQDRDNVNKHYWSLTWGQRRLYVQSRMETAVPKRKYTVEPKRKPKRSFRLFTSDGTAVEVCKLFFLTTLGFNGSNDKVLRIDQSSDYDDKRGKHSKTPLFDRQILTKHVESFEPVEPHYRREHAPLRRYLPSDISITLMHNDFCEKHPNHTVSYELYRKHLKEMNISFTRLGNEECEECESHKLHKQQTSHDVTTQLLAECNDCVTFAEHHERYVKARQLYQYHKTLEQDEKKIFFTGDLEKVIMLPRMETFKSVIFVQRLVTYNMTFAPLGKITTQNKPLAVIWHDGIAGRKQEDLMSAFYEFIIRNRDVRQINIWLDNCTAQNKNWLLFSMLVHLVNSDLISAINITLYYFEPGHTFMSADQVHKQVELAMKRMGKLYDFQDFSEAVESINNGKVLVQIPKPGDFLNMPNYTSDRRIQKSNPRAYLRNMVQVSFRREDFGLLYKNDFDDEFIPLQFMKDSYLKKPSSLVITFRTSAKGIEPQRKAGIIEKLSTIIPPHKLVFWKNLPTGESSDH